jgi:hypothetical protein
MGASFRAVMPRRVSRREAHEKRENMQKSQCDLGVEPQTLADLRALGEGAWRSCRRARLPSVLPRQIHIAMLGTGVPCIGLA